MRITQKKILVTLAALTLYAVSCKDSFLEVTPTGSITDEQLKSKAGLEGSLIGAYSMLSGRGQDFYAGNSNWFWGSVLGGEANKGTNSGDQGQMNEVQNYSSSPGNTSVLAKYRTMYEGIARANSLLRLLPEAQATVAAADKLRMEAEAKFLRAVYYFELKRIYNNTPYIDETVDYAAGINDVKNDKDLYPFIEADLQFAYTNLANTASAAGRANKWAAGAYLGKVLLQQKKYAAALTVFNDVIANGRTSNNLPYNLVANYGSLFRIANDNNAESVFAIQAAAGTGSVNNANPDFVLNYPYNGGPAGCCGFYQPSFELVNSFRTVAGLPILDGSHNTGANQVAHDQGVAATAVFVEDAGPLDPRLDHSVGRRGLPYLDHGNHPGIAWIRDQAYGGPYTPKKYIWSKAEETAGQVDKSSWTPGYDAHNVYLIRFADVLLMAAECEIEAGSLANALTHINRVRTRAANAAAFVMDGAVPAANYVIANYVTLGTQANAREALRMERKLELSGEGHRFFDLYRWGNQKVVLDAYLAYERSKASASGFVGASFTTNKSEFQPIPQTEIDILTKAVLTQNPGY
jgi:hypothetical protein